MPPLQGGTGYESAHNPSRSSLAPASRETDSHPLYFLYTQSHAPLNLLSTYVYSTLISPAPMLGMKVPVSKVANSKVILLFLKSKLSHEQIVAQPIHTRMLAFVWASYVQTATAICRIQAQVCLILFSKSSLSNCTTI